MPWPVETPAQFQFKRKPLPAPWLHGWHHKSPANLGNCFLSTLDWGFLV